ACRALPRPCPNLGGGGLHDRMARGRGAPGLDGALWLARRNPAPWARAGPGDGSAGADRTRARMGRARWAAGRRRMDSLADPGGAVRAWLSAWLPDGGRVCRRRAHVCGDDLPDDGHVLLVLRPPGGGAAEVEGAAGA